MFSVGELVSGSLPKPSKPHSTYEIESSKARIGVLLSASGDGRSCPQFAISRGRLDADMTAQHIGSIS